MKALLRVDEGPIRRKLQNELAKLSHEVQALEGTLNNYFSKDLPQYQSWLNHEFSEQLAEINKLEKKVAALGHHLEESVQLSVKMNLSPEQLFANWSEEEILQKILVEDEVDSSEQEEVLESSPKVAASDESRDVYRRIARCLHPDTRGALSEKEKNLWIKAQKAYSSNDSFELKRIEQCLKCGDSEAEPLSCSEMLRQLEDFRKKLDELKLEFNCISRERAWNFGEKKCLSQLTKELDVEYRAVLKDLKSKESHLSKTLESWISRKEKTPATKPKRRAPKSQESLF